MKIRGAKPDWEPSKDSEGKQIDVWKGPPVALKPGIDSKEKYEKALLKGEQLAAACFPRDRPLEPTPANIKALNAALFYYAHEEAGQQRHRDDVGLSEESGVPHVPAKKIFQALCDLHANTMKALENPELSSKAAAIACFHLKLKEIQTFEDGSGRTAGEFLDRQVKEHLLAHSPEVQRSFEMELDLDAKKAGYNELLLNGLTNRNPVPLIEAIIGQAGIAERINAEEGHMRLGEALNSEKVKEICHSILSPRYGQERSFSTQETGRAISTGHTYGTKVLETPAARKRDHGHEQ